MKLFTAKQMAHIDSVTIDNGVPGLSLMCKAGDAVFEWITQTLAVDKNSNIAVISGKGNNGGDGFRIAEMLVVNGFNSSLYLVGIKDDVRSDDARACMENAQKAGLTIHEISDENTLSAYAVDIMSAYLIVDAIFGTGFKGDLSGFPAQVIDLINDSDGTVISVDIPSGVDATTGMVASHCVIADTTITFGELNVGHILKPGNLHCGTVNVADIGFLPEVIEQVTPYAYTLSIDEASEALPERSFNAHKGGAGHVFVLAGSVGMTGAAALTSHASLRTGAGLVTLGCPSSLNDILEVKLTEVMTLPLPEVRKKRCLSTRALGMIREAVRTSDVVAVGPGLGANSETAELVRRFLSSHVGKVVLDADGINAFKGNAGLLKSATCDMILTPHPGELAALLDIDTKDITSDTISAAKKGAEATGKIILLKGATTVIAEPGGTVWLNCTGNESMATAGMGDVLTGIIAGLAAQGLDLLNSAVLGAYIHGLAGEIASCDKGVHGVIATDVLENIPEAIIDIIHT